MSGWAGAGLGLEEQEPGHSRVEAHGDPLPDRHRPGPEEGRGGRVHRPPATHQGSLAGRWAWLPPQAPLVIAPLPAGAPKPPRLARGRVELAPAPPLPDVPAPTAPPTPPPPRPRPAERLHPGPEAPAWERARRGGGGRGLGDPRGCTEGGGTGAQSRVWGGAGGPSEAGESPVPAAWRVLPARAFPSGSAGDPSRPGAHPPRPARAGLGCPGSPGAAERGAPAARLSAGSPDPCPRRALRAPSSSCPQ